MTRCNRLVPLVLALFPLGCVAPAGPTDGELRPGLPLLDVFLDEGLPRGKAYGLLEQLCTVAPHRLSGSEGAARAVEWGLATMQLLGFENVRLEPVTVPRWERGDIEELVVVEPAEYAGEALAVLALGGSVATPVGGLEGDVIVVSGFDELAGRAEEARGKLVLFNRPMDPRELDPFTAYGGAVSQRTRGADEAAAHGAIGALVRSMTLSHDDEPHTGSLRYGDTVERVPGAAVSTNAADRIAQWITAGKRVRLRLRLSCRTGEPVQSHNVVGEIIGRERPDEIVVVGAHLDAWDVGQGAHDDGAGCIHVLEAGRLIARAGSTIGRPRRTVRCVLFMNEENGLAGGEAYRETHLAALGRHVLAIESDRGGFLPMGYTTDAEGEVRALLTELWGGPPIGRGGGADISPMAAHGVNLAGLYVNPQAYFAVHHSRHDVLARVSPRELELGAIALASMAWLAADHPGEWPRAAAGPR